MALNSNLFCFKYILESCFFADVFTRDSWRLIPNRKRVQPSEPWSREPEVRYQESTFCLLTIACRPTRGTSRDCVIFP
jgi:hypothetical protein